MCLDIEKKAGEYTAMDPVCEEKKDNLCNAAESATTWGTEITRDKRMKLVFFKKGINIIPVRSGSVLIMRAEHKPLHGALGNHESFIHSDK